MATVATVLTGADGRGGLIEELSIMVANLTPRIFSELPFTIVPLEAQGESQALNKTRAFSITLGSMAVSAVGSLAVWRDTHEFTISIRYPIGTMATIAARDDYSQIRDELINTATAVTGVAIRYALNDPFFETFDDHQVMSITVRVITDTTRS